jgi:hypothetical protein
VSAIGLRDHSFEEFQEIRSRKSADRAAHFKCKNPFKTSSAEKGNVTVKQVKVIINFYFNNNNKNNKS